MSHAVARLGLLLAGAVIAVVLLETGLRIGAAFVGPRTPGAAGNGARTVLALGDSHTYGVFFTAAESYPGRLEALLGAADPGRWRVVNLGLPGMNSSEIATRLPAWLAQYGPETVVLCVGVNNVWNRSDADRAGGAQRSGWRTFASGLRVARLFRLLRQSRAERTADAALQRPELERRVHGSGDVAVEFRDAESGDLLIRHEGNFHDTRSLDESLHLLRRDLERIRAGVERGGARLVLLTYAEYPPEGAMSLAQRNHASVNAQLRRFAERHRLALVDAAPRIRERIDSGAAPAAYFHSDGSHPNAAGYALIAEAVAEALAGTGALSGP